MRALIWVTLTCLIIFMHVPICNAIEYQPINDNTYLNIKRSVDVRIPERISEAELKIVAEKINASDPAQYDRVFIMFYLPKMRIGAGAWASAIYNPKLEVNILGSTKEQFEKLTKSSSVIEGKVLGKWFWERTYASATYFLIENSDSLYFEIMYQDGSKGKILVECVSSKRGTRYNCKDKNSFGEYFIVSSDGKLCFYDKEGLIGLAEKQ